MSRESDGYLSFGVGLIFGMGLGAALGILLAPKSGQELRSDIKDLANDIPKIDETKDKCITLIDKTKYSIEKQISQISEAFKAGKMAAAKKKEELEDITGY